jgi:hypothetical protein
LEAAEASGFWEQRRDNFETKREVRDAAMDSRVGDVTQLHECPRCGSTDLKSTH